MRIVGGSLKGRRFEAPRQIKARPTTDMAREGIFNVLENKGIPANMTVLDLFFGVGGMTLEFISRGVKSITSVDINRLSTNHLYTLKKNWDLDNLKIVHADVYKLLSRPKGKFDLVFADPPFADKRLATLPDSVLKTGWIDEKGLFILEHGSDHNFENHDSLSDQYRFGNVHFSFFTLKR